MDLSQQELPITAYFARGKKDKKEAEFTKKRKLVAAADDRGGSAKRGKRAVSPNVHTSAQGSAKRAKKLGKQTKFPTSKSPVASASGRRERALPPGPSDDVVVIDSSPLRPVASSSRSSKANSNAVSRRITTPSFSMSKRPVHLASNAEQSLATPPPTNQTKKRTVKVASTAVVRPLPPRTTVAAITPAIAALPTPETNVRKPSNTHAPSGLRTFIGTSSPCRTKHGSDTHEPSSPSLASPPLIMKLPVPIDNDLDTPSTERTGGSNGIQQAIDPDDPFTCASRDKEVYKVHAVPVSPPTSKESPPAYPNIIEELVPSSQSQYLLALDATPSRKRIAKPVSITNYEPVPSSQSQEEGAMTMASLPGDLLDKLSLASTDFPTPRPITHVAHFNRSERKRPHQFTLGSSPATSPVCSPSKGFSRSFLATKSPINRASFVASPSRSPLKPTSRRSVDKTSPLKKPVERTESMVNVLPAQEDDSVTEPESEPEVVKPQAVQDDDSETEPESEVPVRLPAEIANRKPQDVAKLPRATLPKASIPHASTSSQHSPYRKRQTPDSSYASSVVDLMQEGAGMSVPVSRRCFLLPSRTPPPVVRDFLEMFQDDSSYPDDFPESLR
ncbi:uncharacterized protein EDB91DRAFT_1343126 [Suillus paluster]|uniref:uncharacterized protein n=1 Tax=Suillus paluster TaxID=48578 RepID=UPI001B87EB3C|nr:uncharacterized protein EDB91DRAFT_1343126 [Suillus paluster]KAG1753744.1 hypothetical protein EDB91DRAFT_1343126 [Suillus paluster]